MIRLTLFGATGRMGRSVVKLLPHSKFFLSEAIAHSSSPSLGEELAGIAVFPCFQKKETDLFLDFSLPHAFPASVRAAQELQKPLVLGVTGLSDEHVAILNEASRDIPIFYSPNFSIGIALFRRFAREASKYFQTADLIELHHAQKKDLPSGTALQIAKDSGMEMKIHSIRSGSIIGEHRLILNSEEERIEIIHSAQDRALFAHGALRAASFLLNKPAGLYGMEDLF